MKKTVTEWLGEVKLYEKKIDKIETQLSSMKLFNVGTVGEYALYKETFEKNKADAIALYNSYVKLKENRNKIRAEILKFNATQTIKIGDKEYIIALALEKLKSSEDMNEYILKNQLNKMNSEINKIKTNVESKKESLLESVSKKANTSSSKDIEAVEKAVEQYKLYNEDFLNLQEKLDKTEQEKIEFIENINIQLNLKNATSEIEIEL